MNAIQITETLRANFIRYLLTTFNVGRSELELAEAMRRGFETPGALFRGPFLELNPPYATGRSLHELADEGLIAQPLCRLREDINPPHKRPLPPERPLYLHQERALRQVVSQQRNLVVASGTGSGKTECFLLPILHDLFVDSTPGVRALLIYPMNALVNDQLARLRNLLRGTNITFGRYTSELETQEKKGREKLPDAPLNEIVSREAMRGGVGRTPTPPQILITNYAMLEYLLLRPQDSPLFDSGLWQYVCLDEAHTYTGAQGIEVSLLLRRLKHRLGKRSGQMRCIATSATLIKDDAQAAADFAAQLFGEDFSSDDVIFGETASPTTFEEPSVIAPPMATYLRLPDDLCRQLNAALASNDESAMRDKLLLERTIRELLEAGIVDTARVEAARQEAADGDIARFLWSALKANPHLSQLRSLMRQRPIELEAAGRELFAPGSAVDNQQDAAQSTEAVFRLVELGATAREAKEAAPLLPARYHLFARGPQGAWLCLDPQHAAREGRSGWARLFLDKRDRCDDCGAAVFEMCVCRNCGQPFARAFERDGFFHAESRHPADTSGQRYFTWRQVTKESTEEAESDDDGEQAASGAQTIEICLGCRRRFADCICQGEARRVSLHPVINRNGQPVEKLGSCPRCASRATQKEIATPVWSGARAPLAVLTEDLYYLLPPNVTAEARRKPGEGRKLLSFTDTRQGAARYAAYLQGTSDETLHRHLIARGARELNDAGRVPDVEDLARRCVELATGYGLYGEDAGYVTPAQRRRWESVAMARILAEFCSRTDPRHSLWALGLVGCDVHFPSESQPGAALCSRFGLSPDAMLVVIQSLLDNMRLDKAVTMPEGVRADDEVFGANRATIFYRLTGADKYERNWAGADERQARFDYVQRILLATGKSAENADVRNALQAVWDWLQEQAVFNVRNGVSFQIKPHRLLFPTDGEWYRCNACQRLSRRLIAEGLLVCPSHRCGGELKRCVPEEDFAEDHYRAIFDRRPIGMRVEEHTAQLTPGLGRDYQDKFINGDINVLSCSTTFELGVDVGDLQTVVLNNVPPTVANYRQRAGRAGRRASGAAFILTYAATRPHDRIYFADPPRIIAGEVAVPRLMVGNQIIAQRHLNALLLGHFLRHLDNNGREGLIRSGDFFAPGQVDGRHFDWLERWRSERNRELNQLVERFFEENPDVTRRTPEECLNHLCNRLDAIRQNFEQWLGEYERLRDEHTKVADNPRSRSEKDTAEQMRNRFNGLRQRLMDEALIDFLCREGVLPSYSFPIDVVELRLPRGRQYRGNRFADESLRLERDKKVAIVEYAPGAEIVADKCLWKSVGIVINQQINDYQYRICRTCRDLDRSERGGLPIRGTCRVCGDAQPGESPGLSFAYVDPDGFTTDLTAGVREAGTRVDAAANRSRSFLLAEGEAIKEQAIPPQGEPRLSYSYQRNGCLVALNGGAGADGFWICTACGSNAEPPRPKRSQKQPTTPQHDTPWGKKCSGTLAQYHLGHDFKTDTLHLRFENTSSVVLPSGEDQSFWLSLTYALLEGASLALQIERRDLDGVIRPFSLSERTPDPTANYSQEIVLFDNVPGGAGHVRYIADQLEAVLRRALAVAQCTECSAETSCNSCLRNYDNQIYWEQLKRGQVAVFLESLLAETFPDDLNQLAVGASRVPAPDRPRWLAQQMLAAEQEVLLAVGRITRERPQGEARNWLEVIQDLLRRGRQISLCLAELPPQDRRRPEACGLRDYLRLLVQDYGLRLFTFDQAPFPDWHVVIDAAGENGRAVRLEDADCILHERTGTTGIITTINRDAVRNIAVRLNNLPRHAVTAASLEPPPNVRILHVRDGEQVTEAKLFGDIFRAPLSHLHINDRYLRSAHHENRLRAYLSLINVPDGEQAEIVIATMPAEEQRSNRRYFQTTAEQQQMFARVQRDFPSLTLQPRLNRQLPHDRFLELTRADGTKARISIGVGLDFIQATGRARATEIVIEDPADPG